MQPITELVITNPYVASAVPVVELQLLLLGSVACLAAGVLLAEQTILRQILAGTDVTLTTLVRRCIAETV